MPETALKIVFLDFDGVLNSYPFLRRNPPAQGEALWSKDTLDPAAVNVLNAVLARTGAKIVVSSSWRHYRSLEQLRGILRECGCAGEVLDVTPRILGASRGAEIRAWLEAQPAVPSAFVILDDEPLGDAPEPRWIRMDPSRGLRDSDVERVAALLKEELLEPPPEADPPGR